MPGILGYINHTSKQELFETIFSTINQNQFQVDTYVQNGVHLAKVHLGYLDNTSVPIFSEDHRYCIIMSGELFTYQSHESIDSKFLLEHWIKDGPVCLSSMNGQYAAAIYDFKESELILISDRFGTHPLYYSQQDDSFIFAPEVKAILPILKNKNINYHSVADLFYRGHVFGYKTLFENVFQIPEASCLIFKNGNITIKRYWDYPYYDEVYKKKDFSKQEKNRYIDECASVLYNAVKRQVQKNSEDILFSLSGGMDSRYVIALADQLGVRPITAFTMGEENSEDVLYAKLVAQHLNIDHQCFKISPFSIWKHAALFSYIADGMSMIYGPIQNIDPMAAYPSKKITLTSQMCDALMGSTLYRKRIKKLLQKDLFDTEATSILQTIFTINSTANIQKTFITTFFKHISGYQHSIPDDYLDKQYHPVFSYFKLLMNEHGRRGTLGGNLIYNYFFETRMPSYDYDVIDFAFHLPVELKKQQYVYRQSFIRMFPELAKFPRQGTGFPIDVSNFRLNMKSLERRIIGRLKHTPASKIVQKFSRWNRPSYIHYKKWFSNELKNSLEELLFDSKTQSREIFDKEGITSILYEHYYTEKDHSWLIWQIVNLEYFFRNFID